MWTEGRDQKIVLGVSQEEPPNVHIDVQPLQYKLIPYFCIQLVGKFPLD
jgi:hypothetical protein